MEHHLSSALVMAISAASAAGGADRAEPSTGPGLVLWLDAGDVDGDGDPANDPPAGAPIARWADRSGGRHHAVQESGPRRPTYAREAFGPGRHAVRFDAKSGQFLSAGSSRALDIPAITAFVVARASRSGSDMWLFSKNDWGGPWTGYGIAIGDDGLHPWPHLGLETGRRGYFKFGGSLGPAFQIVELVHDGEAAGGALDGRLDEEQVVEGRIARNDRELLVGTLGPQHLEGEIAELLIYGRALDSAEREQTRRYLAEKHGLTLAPPGQDRPMTVVENGYLPVTVRRPATPATRTLTEEEAEAALRRDWLFQAMEAPLLDRALAEIGWARERARDWDQGLRPRDTAEDLAALDELESRALAARVAADPSAAEDLYLAVRRVKRRMLLKSPAVDFDALVLIDQPFPRGPEWPHEAVHRLGHRAVAGGRLLVLEGLHPGGRVRQLYPDRPGSFWRPDVSFDGTRALFCYKAHDEKSFHLHEIRLDGSGPRQLTDTDYDDIDPIYLPDGRIVFTTTRGNSYVRCGPYIYAHVLARCEADGSDVYLLSQNSETDFVPALLNDGRVAYSRWEYSDKDQNRVQSLWTTNQDGTSTAVLWGNQSVWPDHLAEPRPLPGSGRILFTGVGHHDWFKGSLGIVDPARGSEYPHGLTRVTADLPWAEVADGPVERQESDRYHSSGRYRGYLGAYPLSEEEFLVSALGPGDKFRLYLLDVHGNRELIYEGVHNAWYAVPIRRRAPPPRRPDGVAWPGIGEDRVPAEPGVLYSPDVCRGVPELQRGAVKYLRVFQQDAKTYSTWTKTFEYSGPPVSAVQTEAVKRIVSTVPVEPDGSVHFQVPAGKALYFQLLDERHRAVHTMRSFTGAMPGERRGCLGCHEQHAEAPPAASALAIRRPPTPLTPPPWGTESIGYERFVQPVLDRHCGACHQGDGEARAQLDLTLRPGEGRFHGTVFKDPYLTLIGAAAWPVPAPGAGRPGYGAAGAIPVYGLGPADVRASGADGASTLLSTLRPGRYLSVRSRLVEIAMGGVHHDVKVDPPGLRRLIAWVDANCPYLGEEEIRAMDDPSFEGIERLPIRPRVRTAPTIERP